MKNIDHVKREEEGSRKALVDALENAREASQAKGNFLSRISHEIRTPLNAIIGYISIARQADSDKEKIEHCLENSEIASRHLLSILNDVLDMSSIERGKLKIAKEAWQGCIGEIHGIKARNLSGNSDGYSDADYGWV